MARDPLALAAGELRHQALIQAPSILRDSMGQPTTSWTPVFATRAKVESTTERQVYQNQQFTSEVTHIVTMRWPGTAVRIAPGMQVVIDGTHTYKIQAPNNVLQRNRVLKLMCLELNGAE
jgi:SPP1 family predicted phage head-tail adaptor